MGSDLDGTCGPDALRGNRQFPHANPSRVADRIGDCCGGRTLGRLASTEERLAGAVDDMHLYAVRHATKAKDRIGTPVLAGDASVIESVRLVQGPARRLHNAALDLVADAVRIHRLPAIDRRHRAYDPNPPGISVDRDLCCYRRIGPKVLVASEGETAAITRPLAIVPTEMFGRGHDHVASARIVKVAQPELDGIDAGGRGQLVHKALD